MQNVSFGGAMPPVDPAGTAAWIGTSKYISRKSLFESILQYFYMQGTFIIFCCLWR